MTNCELCTLLHENESRVVWQDGIFAAVLDQRSGEEGQITLMPKFHTDHLIYLPDDFYGELLRRVHFLSALLRRASGASRIFLRVQSLGVPHINVQLTAMFSTEPRQGARSAGRSASFESKFRAAVHACLAPGYRRSNTAHLP